MEVERCMGRAIYKEYHIPICPNPGQADPTLVCKITEQKLGSDERKWGVLSLVQASDKKHDEWGVEHGGRDESAVLVPKRGSL